MKNILVLLLLVLSINVWAQDVMEFTDSLFTFRLSMNKVINEDSSDLVLIAKEIRIFSADGKEFQSIVVEDPQSFYAYDTSRQFIMVDANFDGHTDIGLQNWFTVRMDRQYQFWFYNSVENIFELDTCLRYMMNPDFNPKKKLVCNYSHDGGMDGSYSKYKWDNNRLVLVDRRSFEQRNVLKGKKKYVDQGIITHTWLENGEMKETITETEDIGLGQCNCE